MAIQRCPRCFQEREESKRPVLPDVKVCGSCAMDLGGAIGFLEYQGFLPLTRKPVETTGEEPPSPPERADLAADASEYESRSET